MFSQRDTRWAKEQLGFGNNTIGSSGCFLTCIAQELQHFGHDYTPQSLNKLFKERSGYSGTQQDLIDITRLPTGFPDMFSDALRRTDVSNLNNYLSSGWRAVAEVSPEPIGGTGQHFVLILEGGNDPLIGDPFFGIEERLSVRYKQFKSLRLLQIKNAMQITDQTILEVDGVKKEWQSWKSDIRLVPKMAVDLENANKKITDLETSLTNFSLKVDELTESVAESQKQLSVISDEARLLTEENKRFKEVDEERKAWKSRYENALLTQTNKYSGWQLVTMGLSQIIQNKWQKKQ